MSTFTAAILLYVVNFTIFLRGEKMVMKEIHEKRTPVTDGFLSVDEMAKELSIARATAYQLTKTSDFPCFYIGKRIIIPVSEFKNWVSKQAQNKSAI